MIIPISFKYDEKEYQGEFKNISGGGSSSMFFLMINNYFFGQLFYTPFGWQFASNKNHFTNMAEYFGNHVSAWLDSSDVMS